MTLLLVARLAVPVVEVLDASDHADAAPGDLVRARVVADVVRLPRAVHEVGHSVRPGAERVSDPRGGRTGDDRPRADGMVFSLRPVLGRTRGRPQLKRPVAFEHDEHLFLFGMAMRRGA